MRKKIICLLCAIILVVSMAACSNDSSQPPAADNDQGKAVEYKDELVIQMTADITNLDPAYLSSVDTSRVGYLIFDHLVRYDKKGNIVPRLAERWETSEDGLTWTFYLRQNAKWHDGTPVKASEIKYNYDRIKDPNTAAPRAADLAAIKSIDAPDDYTVVFHLEEPFAAFIDKCLLVNPALIAQPAALEEYGKDFSNKPVGSGPYKLVEWVPGEKVVLEANEDFYLGAPATKKVVFKIIPDVMTAMIELEEGQIDMLLNVPQSELSRFKEVDSIELLKAEDYNVSWLFLNVNKSPFDDIKVRKALAHSIDRDTIYETLISDIGVKADGTLPTISWAYEKDTEDYNYDPELSKTLLKEAGWEDKDGDGFVEKNGKKLTVEINAYTREPENQVLEAVQNYFKKAGIDAKLNIGEKAAFTEKMLKKTEYGTYTLRISQDNPEPVLFIELIFHSKGSFCLNNYKNEKVDQLLEEARRITDMEKRKELYSEAQKLIKEDYPMIPLFSVYNQIGVNKKLEGYEHSTSCFDILNVKVRK